MIYDEGWDLFGYSGWSPQLNAMVVSFRCAAATLLLLFARQIAWRL